MGREECGCVKKQYVVAGRYAMEEKSWNKLTIQSDYIEIQMNMYVKHAKPETKRRCKWSVGL